MDASLLKVHKKDYKEIDVYYIDYASFNEIANCNNIDSRNAFYLMIDKRLVTLKKKAEISI